MLYHLVECATGGIKEANYPGELPCNELPVSNFKRGVKKHHISSAGNDLYTVMLQAHLEDTGNRFIHDINFS